MTHDDYPLVAVENLQVHYTLKQSGFFLRDPLHLHAVDGITFSIESGKTLGLVGESGCGKSTTGRAILYLERPTAGTVRFQGTDLSTLDASGLRALRRHMQIVFQDPISSLNPRLTIGQIVGEPLAVHHLAKGSALRDRVAALLTMVQLSPDVMPRFPHEFSGGQRQRIGIARALAVQPSFLVLDEPVSALDVSIQAQILALLDNLQQELQLTYLLIAHDLAIVGQMSDYIAVMYLGKIVETAERDPLFQTPTHPYTQALFSAIPIPDPSEARQQKRIILSGEVPSPINPPLGCRFHPRCPLAQPICRTQEPPLRTIVPGHNVACHFAEHAKGLFTPLYGLQQR